MNVDAYKNDMNHAIRHRINQAVYNFTREGCSDIEEEIKKAIASYAMKDGVKIETEVDEFVSTVVTTIRISIDINNILRMPS